MSLYSGISCLARRTIPSHCHVQDSLCVKKGRTTAKTIERLIRPRGKRAGVRHRPHVLKALEDVSSPNKVEATTSTFPIRTVMDVFRRKHSHRPLTTPVLTTIPLTSSYNLKYCLNTSFHRPTYPWGGSAVQ